MTISRVVIVGVGAVGGSIAGLVANSGMHIAMVARGEHGRAIRENGLRLALFDGDLLTCAECFESVSEVDWQLGDIVVLATKLNDAQQVMNEVLTAAGKGIPIVCATNGVIAESWAESRFENVIGMMVWLPATHLKPGEVMLHSTEVRGALDVGGTKNATRISQALASILQKSGFDSLTHENILAWKRAKWITNLGGAAQAMVEDDWMSVLKAAQAEGENTLEHSGLPRIATRELLDRCDSIKLTEVQGFVRSGGSTWQSRQRGKPLESIFIEGAMADLGESLGVPVPVNRFLAEASKQPRSFSSDEILTKTIKKT
jgi:2-dehydropantoate 2-reductase